MFRPPRKFRIALIGCETHIAETIGESLYAMLGGRAQVSLFGSPAEFPEKGKRADLVLFDVSGGASVADSMHELWRINDKGKCPVIIMDEVLDGDLIREARRFGASDYVRNDESGVEQVIRKVRPHAIRMLRPQKDNPFWLPGLSVTPGALIAILLTSLLAAWMYYTFNT